MNGVLDHGYDWNLRRAVYSAARHRRRWHVSMHIGRLTPRVPWAVSTSGSQQRLHLATDGVIGWLASGRPFVAINTVCGSTLTSARLYLNPPDLELCDHCVLADFNPGWGVYRAFNADGGLLYIGYTGQFFKRMEAHRGRESWFRDVARIDWEPHPTRKAALAAELRAHQVERPPHNYPGGYPSTWPELQASA